MSQDWIPFHRPWRAAGTAEAMQEALQTPHWQGGGEYTRRCEALLAELLGARRVLLTQSCTSALEMATLLLDLQAGDEVILPSWTFPSCANAILMRGATPVFVDVLPGSLSLDPVRVEAAITARSRAVMVVHYGGIAVPLTELKALCDEHSLVLIEDAAQALGASCGGVPAGSVGSLATLSFHDTKNISCGEGGALVINDPDWVQAAEEIWEKGTNRLAWTRGEVPHYEWVRLGSSCLPSEITAALLLAQLPDLAAVSENRQQLWRHYAQALNTTCYPDLSFSDCPSDSAPNGHSFHLVLPSMASRDRFVGAMRISGVDCRSHFQALHRSLAGLRCARTQGAMPVTAAAHEGLVRLPLWPGMPLPIQHRIVECVTSALALQGICPASPAPVGLEGEKPAFQSEAV